jgi:isopenicillin N synthase-like dioxygenase
MGGIPIVDLREFAGDFRSRAQHLATLRSGLCEFGFLTVEGHGVDPRLIRRVYAGFERFFERPDEAKRRCSGVPGGQRGFTGFGIEHAKDSPHPDLKEFFHVGQERAETTVDYPPNVWPDEIPSLRDDCLRLFGELEACAEALLSALAESFELEPDVFASMIRGGNSILRALHYPPVPSGADPRSIRAAPHEDINLVTLLCEATDSGLEIFRGEWLPVEVSEGQIIADAGDMLSRVTNGVVPATTHRVVAGARASRRHRYSLPFFAHPRPDCDLSVMDRFVTDERPAKFAPITAGDFLTERLRDIGLVS